MSDIRLKRALSLAALASMIALSAFMLAGCAQGHEIKDLFIVTAIALDTADEPGMLDVSLQAAKVTQGGAGSASESGGSGGGGSGGGAGVVRKARERTLAEAIRTIDRNSTRTTFIHHNQAILFGAELAAQGLSRYIDLLARDTESRMEVPLFVAEGRAEEMMDVEMDQEPLSGQFLGQVVESLGDISPQYEVRMFDFLCRLVDGTSAPVATLIRSSTQGDQKKIEVAGLAVFLGDRYVSSLDNDEALGYIWAMGDVRDSHVVAESEDGVATFFIDSLQSAQQVALRPDGGVQVELLVRAELSVGELAGFAELEGEALIERLLAISGHAIGQGIEGTFARAREMGADIYRFGAALYRRYPDEWEAMKDRWREVFQDIEFSVQVETIITNVGQLPQSLSREKAYEH